MNVSEGKLLLVEDDEAFAWAASRAMERRGYEVRHAGEFERARNLVEDEDFEYAVLDLNLGNCTSLDLILPLRERNPDMRILVLTGYASIATAVRAIKLGADNYLAKPADTDEILTALLTDSEPDADAELLPMSVRRLEWEHIQKVLEQNNGNISATARQLNMHRRTLQRKLQKRPVQR
ncbi:MAG: response regulator transcription factor [Gammaproteobacteria bacterium]|nr:response regulator transcription factor [Gammaproteobacteria bacterium]MYH46453.1 response regulator transcription factor [Gammaproteobacteria bacterium]MYL13385.1 response regulator transcription factor [Gammaproteobacteria bacterium]